MCESFLVHNIFLGLGLRLKFSPKKDGMRGSDSGDVSNVERKTFPLTFSNVPVLEPLLNLVDCGIPVIDLIILPFWVVCGVIVDNI